MNGGAEWRRTGKDGASAICGGSFESGLKWGPSIAEYGTDIGGPEGGWKLKSGTVLTSTKGGLDSLVTSPLRSFGDGCGWDDEEIGSYDGPLVAGNDWWYEGAR